MTRPILRVATLVVLAAFLVLPFAWMILVSLHPSNAPIPDYKEILPASPHWSNYATVLNNPELPVRIFFLNSIFVAAVIIVGQLFITSLAGFALSRLPFKGSNFVFWSFLASMMFTGVVTQIPVYLMMRELRWLDTFAALIVPGLSSSFNVFLFRQFMITLPKELDEAAMLDGAGPLRVYSRIVLPLSGPVLATAAAFTFFAVWTDFFWPLLSTNSLRMRTLEVGLSIFKNSYGSTNWPLQMTAATVTLVPMIIVFAFAQKWFVRGIQMSGLK